jgi:hypothetical protein
VSGSLLYFKFDESAGSSAFDSSGSGLTGSLVNGPVWVSGRSGNGLQFDGVNDYVRVGDVLDIYDRITLSVWIKPATVSRDQDIVCKDWQTSYMGYEFGINSAGELMFRINPTSSSYAYRTSSGAGITTNTWQHVAVTFDGTNVRFYKNGALITTVAGSGRLYSSSEVVYVGTYETTGMYVFSGALDELRIYNRQLSSSEINQLYTSLQGEGLTTTSTTSVSTTTTRITTTTTTTSTTRTTTTTTNTTTTSTPLTCRVGSGYTFTGVGSYTASSSSGVPSLSRGGQYTFYETPHNYVNNMNCPWSGTYTCPAGTNIRFYLRAYTEEGYDYFNIRNSGGTVYAQLSGDSGTPYFWSDSYSQRTAAFNFVSDEDTFYWGIDLYRIECLSITSTTTTTTRLTTTTTTTRVTTTTTRTTTTTTIGGQCYGAEACNPTGDPIGGGPGYSKIISGTEAAVKYSVSTKAELLTALNNAKSGEIVFVRKTAVIDMTGTSTVTIPAGVTLASDRGLAGSSGALIRRTSNLNGGWEEPMFKAGGDNVRVTGLIIEGEMLPQDSTGRGERYYLVGLHANGVDNFEVDNCELRGWSWAAVSLRDSTNSYIHHNYIHHNQAAGEGYGTCHYSGDAIVEANIYNYNRHDITGAGLAGEEYTFRYNINLGYGTASGGSRLDVHADESGGAFAGRLFYMHHNTFYDNGAGVQRMLPIQISEKPTVGAYIYNNDFKGGTVAGGYYTGPIRQLVYSSFG